MPAHTVQKIQNLNEKTESLFNNSIKPTSDCMQCT